MNCLYSIARCIDDFHVFRRYIFWGVNTISKKSSAVLMIRKFTMIKRKKKINNHKKTPLFSRLESLAFSFKSFLKALDYFLKGPKTRFEPWSSKFSTGWRIKDWTFKIKFPETVNLTLTGTVLSAFGEIVLLYMWHQIQLLISNNICIKSNTLYLQ